ncbi:uncharacterized protein LOC120263932 [Dioscorea cayenensis subsp. rotundata]|uniref:Uncharacterized protein LOC120263932 n=1 Tax=Dioscorea cayennensis subsp. rotundata TaxID=55577 RepID=A0AB40BKB3_DIOCR|nr:uncharacterized protein LOC120263932 [Dioscorea cayenensis subsp. rotundata]
MSDARKRHQHVSSGSQVSNINGSKKLEQIMGASTGEVIVGREIHNHPSFITTAELIQRSKKVAANQNKNEAPREHISATTDFADFLSQTTVDFPTQNSATFEGNN